MAHKTSATTTTLIRIEEHADIAKLEDHIKYLMKCQAIPPPFMWTLFRDD